MSALTQEQQRQVRNKIINSVESVSETDVEYASKKGQEEIDKLGKDVPSMLKEVWREVKLMVSMLKDYGRSRYTEVPWKTIAAITAAIIYFASPLDFIPDFVPVIGYADDLFVFAVALEYVREDLEKYGAWRDAQA